MRVLLLDDHLLFAQGMQTLLRALAPNLSTQAAASLDDALDLVRQCDYDLVLLDWHLADGTSGATVLSRFRELGSRARIIVVSADADPAVVQQALQEGAAGFIPKSHGSASLLAALDVVVHGGVYLPDSARYADDPAPHERLGALVDIETRHPALTPRQADVYRATARGLSNKVIARELGITEPTVKSHLTLVYAELALNSRA
ncbi:MAG: response regulator transcription factor, partial [Rhizobacter sp.]